MKLISLQLHNFRKYKDAEIRFPEGIIGLIGNNGSGKSTIIEAIGWAIYGNRASRTPKDEIKRQGASRSDDCWVKLVFEFGGDEYEVFRIISGNSTDARVKVNGLITASSSQKVTEYLEKRLGMDYDSFFTSIVAKQQELNALSDKSPGERRKSMLRMLGIDVLEEAIRRVREDRRNKEKILDFIEKTFKDIDELERQLQKEREVLAALFSNKERLEEELREAEAELKKIEEERNKEREKAEKYKQLNEKKKILETNLRNKENLMEEKKKEKEEIVEKKVELENIKPVLNEFDELYARKENLENLRKKFYEKKNLQEQLKLSLQKINSLNKELEGYTEEIEKLKKSVELYDKINDDILKKENNIKKIEREIERCKAEINSLLKERKNYEEKRNKIISLGPDSECPTCGRILGEKYEEILSNFEGKIKEIEEEIKEKELENSKLLAILSKERESVEALKKEKMLVEKDYMDYRTKEKLIESIHQKLNEEEERKRKLEENLFAIGEVEFDEAEYEIISNKVKELLPIKNKAIVLENEVKRLPSIEKDLMELEKDIAMIKNDIVACIDEINQLGFNEEKYKAIEEKYEEARNKFFEKREEFIRTEGKIETVKKEIERIEKEIEEQKEQRERAKKLRKEIELLEELAGERDKGLLNEFKTYLISRIRPLLAHYASHFINIFTNGKYKEIELDEKYDIYIYDRGERFQLDRFSGGEKDLANLSLRLAISQLIAQRADISLNFIALDEIFGSQDRERRRNVLNALAELKKQFKQIILITHIDEIKDSMENIIRVYEDEDGISHAILE